MITYSLPPMPPRRRRAVSIDVQADRLASGAHSGLASESCGLMSCINSNFLIPITLSRIVFCCATIITPRSSTFTEQALASRRVRPQGARERRPVVPRAAVTRTRVHCAGRSLSFLTRKSAISRKHVIEIGMRLKNNRRIRQTRAV